MARKNKTKLQQPAQKTATMLKSARSPAHHTGLWIAFAAVALVAIVAILIVRANSACTADAARSEALLLGAVEQLDTKGVTGWALDAGNPGASTYVVIYVDDKEFVRRMTDLARDDVNTFFSINGIHGFSVSLAGAFADGNEHQVRVETVVDDRTLVMRDELVR